MLRGFRGGQRRQGSVCADESVCPLRTPEPHSFLLGVLEQIAFDHINWPFACSFQRGLPMEPQAGDGRAGGQ